MGHSIRDMKDGENYEGALWLVTGQERQTKNGDPYWEGTFQDATGSIAAKLWDSAGGKKGRVKALSSALVTGGVVQVTAKVDSYNGTLQLNLLSAQIAQAGQFDPSWFSPRSQRSTEEMEAEFTALVEGAVDRDFRALLEAFHGEKDIFRRFCEGPAAKAIHHAWVGGLLEHTLALARNMLALTLGYPLLDRDLLLCACVFHDAGKVFEISSDPGFEYTTDGKLLGHIYMGARLVERLCDGLPGFPEEKRRHLVHIVLSHQGERSLGFGSAADPATPEAIFFHHLDNLDAKLQNCLSALERSEAAGETGAFTPARFGPIRTTFYRVRPAGGALDPDACRPAVKAEEGSVGQEQEEEAKDAKPPQPRLW